MAGVQIGDKLGGSRMTGVLLVPLQVPFHIPYLALSLAIGLFYGCCLPQEAIMALYLISYDINEKDEFEYGPLWQRLKSMGAVKILDSEWAMEADESSASMIYVRLAAMVQSKDRLLIQEVTSDAAWDKVMISDDAFQKLLRSART
jgi:hypothetical protein